MYEDHFRFSESPFSLAPDPKYYFRSTAHANACELVQYAIARSEGVIAVTGEAGAGKTTLCRAICDELGRTVFTAPIMNPPTWENEFLRVVLQEFGIVSRDQLISGILAPVTNRQLIDVLKAFLRSLQELGAQALLIVDEAQNLTADLLEQIKMLSNIKTGRQKLLQIVLVGRPNLRDTLRRSEMRHQDQRVSLKCELKPLSRDETFTYVRHRIVTAGGAAAVFSAGALGRVYGCTRGVPGLVNVLCDRALVEACGDRSNRVLSGHVDRAAEALDLARPGRLLLAWARG